MASWRSSPGVRGYQHNRHGALALSQRSQINLRSVPRATGLIVSRNQKSSKLYETSSSAPGGATHSLKYDSPLMTMQPSLPNFSFHTQHGTHIPSVLYGLGPCGLWHVSVSAGTPDVIMSISAFVRALPSLPHFKRMPKCPSHWLNPFFFCAPRQSVREKGAEYVSCGIKKVAREKEKGDNYVPPRWDLLHRASTLRTQPEHASRCAAADVEAGSVSRRGRAAESHASARLVSASFSRPTPTGRVWRFSLPLSQV